MGGGALLGEDLLVVGVVFVGGVAGGAGVVVIEGFGGGVVAEEVFALGEAVVVVVLAGLGRGLLMGCELGEAKEMKRMDLRHLGHIVFRRGGLIGLASGGGRLELLAFWMGSLCSRRLVVDAVIGSLCIRDSATNLVSASCSTSTCASTGK